MIKKFLKKLLFHFISMIYDKKYLSFDVFLGSKGGINHGMRYWFDQKIKGYNRHCPFPVNPTTVIGNVKNLHFDIHDIDNFWKTGCYYQCWNGHIYIGSGTWIAQNVGIITENHNPNNLKEHLPSKDVSIGRNCWIGMNAVIMPGVILGDKTIVGAGSVVTHSFKEGNCIIAGVPAKIIKKLDVITDESN